MSYYNNAKERYPQLFLVWNRYYVNNEYGDAELKENPPTIPQFDKLMRNILATNPRVTRFKVDWDDTNKSSTTKGEQIVESDSHQKMDASLLESMNVV